MRTECLDHLLIFSRTQLERVLHRYVSHYNGARPHRGIELETPIATHPVSGIGRIERRDVLGGLIHEYEQAA